MAGCLCGCGGPCERLSRRCPPIEYVRDSIEVHDTFVRETTITDTLLYVKLITETERVVVGIEDTARAETAYARATAWTEGERLRLLLINKDSAEAMVQRIKTLERELHETQKIKEKTVVKTEYRTRGIVRFLAWTGGITLILFLFFIVFHIAKRFIKP